MEAIRLDSASARLLAGAARESIFTLVDVGCSGGIDPGWRVYGPRLKAFGFDPSVHEIARLSAAEDNPQVRYVAGFVGLPDGHPCKGAVVEPWRVDPWTRLSACRTQALQRQREAAACPPPAAAPAVAPAAPAVPAPAAPEAASSDQGLMQSNRWHEAELTDPDRPIVLPQFLEGHAVADVDFIKVDVDGADFEILQSLEASLDDLGVLGVMMEVSFHGGAGEHYNTFHNVDRFMRARGFDLFELTVRKYSLAVLPRPYLFRHPFAAQTVGGRPFQGDALYLRDLGHDRLEPVDGSWSDAKLLKLASVFALFGLLDHAADILIRFRERLETHLDVGQALDVLTVENQALDADLWESQGVAGYEAFVAAYEQDDPVFYGANERRHHADLSRKMAQDEAAARIAALEVQLGLSREQVQEEAAHTAQALEARQAALDRCAEAMAETEAMRRSLSWRLTAGLRELRRRAPIR